jgi:Cu-Zn family superoxide dismutase
MRTLPLLALLAASLSLGAAVAETPATGPSATPPAAPAQPSAPVPSRTADLKNAGGATIGQVQLWTTPTGVLIRLTVRGLTPGWHGLHLHETGDCSAAGFASAGAHIRMAHTGAHGLLNPSGPEAGDLPNLFVGADGVGAAEVSTRRVLMTGDGEAPSLLDADGSALVVHAAPDDQFTQPTGGSSARIACAVIR